MMNCDMDGGGMWMMMALGLVGTLLVLAAIAGLIYLLVRGILSAVRSHRDDPALAELRATFARGAITSEEYEQRLELLQRRRR